MARENVIGEQHRLHAIVRRTNSLGVGGGFSMRYVTISAALLLPAHVALAEPTQLSPRVGDTYEIRMESKSSRRTSDGSSSGNSNSRNTIVERLIEVNQAGLELEYDLPKTATAQDRARSWQFPARVLKPVRGPMQLLNGAELEMRLDGWLKGAGLTRAACGRWIFTWNAFRIECDPQSVIVSLEPFDLRPADLRDGAPYQDPRAHGPAPLTRKAVGSDTATFIVEMAVDADAVRRERVEADLAVAEIRGETLALDAARRARSDEDISGTITVTFDMDAAGLLRQRTKVTRLDIRTPDGRLETRISTEHVERQYLSRIKS